MATYLLIILLVVIIIFVYLAIVIYNTPPNPKKHQSEKFEDTEQDIPSATNQTPQHQALTREYKVRFVEPRTCYAKIEGKERYRMQSYNQLFEYWFPGMNCRQVQEEEPADIAIIGNGCSDNTALRPNEVNILISIENVPHWNQYPHYSKYGDYNDPLIDIFVYNHKYSIESLADQNTNKTNKHKIMIPTILFRMNYFISNYDHLKISATNTKPPKDRKFCLMVNKSGLNSKAGQFQEKMNSIAPTDHISLYDKEIGESSCYNPPELLEIFNQYRFIICFENSYAPGYITEKIFNCLLADTIPIYSGSPIIHDFINPDCFINIGENDDLDQAIAKISEINSDPEKYSQYLTAQKISQKYLDTGINTEFKNKFYDAILAKQSQQE